MSKSPELQEILDAISRGENLEKFNSEHRATQHPSSPSLYYNNTPVLGETDLTDQESLYYYQKLHISS